jgi:hypothetical protein
VDTAFAICDVNGLIREVSLRRRAPRPTDR